MPALRHLVLFHVRPGTGEELISAALEGLRVLGNDPGLLEWRIELSLDTRKGPVIVVNALFRDRDALERFRVSDAHAESAARLAAMADWVVGDYLEARTEA